MTTRGTNGGVPAISNRLVVVLTVFLLHVVVFCYIAQRSLRNSELSKLSERAQQRSKISSYNNIYDEPITVSGVIKFPDGAPDALGDADTLTVKLEDTSKCDAGAKLLGTKTIGNSLYKKDGTLYTIKADHEPHEGCTLSVSVVLNFGWSPSGDDWVHEGDFLTTTSCNVAYVAGTNDYELNIEPGCIEKCGG